MKPLDAIALHMLAEMFEAHGSAAMLKAVADACGNCADFHDDPPGRDNPVRLDWLRAKSAVQGAIHFVKFAEEQSKTVDLASSLLVLSEVDQ